MVYSVAGIALTETRADMNASNFAIVTMSRTIGSRCRMTGSGVSNAAAIAGRAAFFAPLMDTLPRKGFPPQILNLSMPVEFRSLSWVSTSRGLAESEAQIVASCAEPLAGVGRFNAELQGHQRGAKVVSAFPQSVLRRGQWLAAGFRQNVQTAILQLAIAERHIDHQVVVDMSKPHHHRGREHVQYQFFGGAGLQAC